GCSADCALDVFGARQRPQADEVVLVRGVAVLEELARRGVDPLASDVVAESLAHDAPPGGRQSAERFPGSYAAAGKLTRGGRGGKPARCATGSRSRRTRRCPARGAQRS